MFYNFHKMLLYSNKTTIENLEHKGEKYTSKFDIDPHYNYIQVYGTKRIYDWIPIMPSSAKPKGDGIYFSKNCKTEESDEEEGEGSAEQQETRHPANLGNSRASMGQPNQGGNQQDNSSRQFDNNDNRQGDVMTIHNDRGSQYRNLNNIVRSDNPIQEIRSEESKNSRQVAGQVAGSQIPKKQFVNEISNKEYEELK